jgi:hypothetical protein
MEPGKNKESPRPFILPKVVDDGELSFVVTFSLFLNGEIFAAATGLL